MLEFLEVMTSFTISVNYGAVKESALIVFGIVLLIMIVAVIKDVDGRALDKAIKVVKKNTMRIHWAYYNTAYLCVWHKFV